MPQYDIKPEMRERLNNTYKYHSPTGDQPKRYEEIRQAGKFLAETIVKNSPVSREQSVALTELEGVIMWANAAIARNEQE